MSGHMGVRNMHEGAISRDISLLMILALEGLWKACCCLHARGREWSRHWCSHLVGPRGGLVCPPTAGGTGRAVGRSQHGQLHRGSAPFPILQLDFATWGRAAENSMFLLVSVGVESRAAFLMVHAHSGAGECASASPSHVTGVIV